MTISPWSLSISCSVGTALPLALTIDTGYTHLVGTFLPEPNTGYGLLAGTGKFKDATGEVHLRGVISQATDASTSSRFNGIHEVVLTTTSEDNYEYVFRKSGAITPELHILLAILMVLLPCIGNI